MNRNRSSDSLDNGDDDAHCPSSASSSPLEFTSDDETSTDTNFLISGYNRSRLNRQNISQNQNRSQISQREPYFAEASTSYWNHDRARQAATNPVVSFDGYDSHIESKRENRLTNRLNTLDLVPTPPDLLRVIQDINIDIDPAAINITRPGTNSSSTVSLFCAKLVECRSLTEIVEYIDRNRDIIDTLTSIVREAPAFRNYDLGNYQIDYSVKESFNPSFWLDREPIVTTADGNCQYHAVSLSLTGSEDYTNEVRLATAVAVVDNMDYFDPMLNLIDKGTVLDLVHTIARSYCWGDETTLKAIAVAINRRIFLYSCNTGKKDYEILKTLSKEELLDAFKEKKYRGGTGIHTYADPLDPLVPASDYIMLFHKSEHFIAVLPTSQQLTMFEPYNPIVPNFI